MDKFKKSEMKFYNSKNSQESSRIETENINNTLQLSTTLQ